MAATEQRWTAQMLRALPDDGRRHEIVHGELLVTPAPSWTHQDAVAYLSRAIGNHLNDHRVAKVLTAPADVELTPDTVVQPDIFVVPRIGGRAARQWQDAGRLLLAVEVLSPSTAFHDRVVKRRLYMEHDIAEYWIVDLDARCVERWRRGEQRPEIVADRLEWTLGPDVPALMIELPAFFAEVLDE